MDIYILYCIKSSLEYNGCQGPLVIFEAPVISQTVEYALRAVAYLGQNPKPRTTQEIARVTRVPAAYLAKVMQSLCRAGIVNSQRGIHGGFTLSRSPDELTVLETVNAVEPIQRIRECPLGLAAHGTHLCPLHRRLDEAMAQVERAFRESTLSEILAEPTSSIPLCEFPPPCEVHAEPPAPLQKGRPKKAKAKVGD